MTTSDPFPSSSRRAFLRRAGLFGMAAPLGVFASPTSAGIAPLPPELLFPPICRVAADGTPAGQLRKISLAWNATAICTAAAPVAKEKGIFAKYGLDVEFVNFGGSTEQLLEAIATGKADGGIGMALRWLKPLEQGFDVKITTGVHGGCLRLVGSKAIGTTTLASLKGKTIAISDQASPAKNFFGLLLAKQGIDPERDVTWRNYPADLLPLAVEKGEAQALADADPRTYIFLKDPKLVEIATNLTGEFANRSCCVLALRGALVRDDRAVAAALTKAVLEGGHIVATEPRTAAQIFSGYGGKGSIEDLAAMLGSQTHHHHPVGPDLKKEIALYIDELKVVNVIRKSTDPAKFADRVYADVLS
ncbi:ABC transporter substrate-binding protein [Enterovirga rhinocerotis]|uniref:NitT/TauT family transport system substrate-binding protein n=1 Tax=Enterovirga rhinocerotis TaxID=1339210 RepID=A0A4R7BJT1_9HYPH|nr:ABC transporter substrate-binding protein [Enterovirga rhinocerotis]TDR85263.1 NitT/TauT family transport system substrate-binding protein [Enterovirga rhinocerotis]